MKRSPKDFYIFKIIILFMLVLMAGLPATGKSTIAKHLAKKLNANILRTDVIRKQIFEKPAYTPEEKKAVYNAQFLIAEYLIKAGQHVILDGTFYQKALRKRVYNLSRRAKTEFVVVETVADENVIKSRMEKREKNKGQPSDADYDIYLKLKEQFEPISRHHIKLDTAKSVKSNLDELYSKLKID